MKAQEFVTEAKVPSVRDQIRADVVKHAGGRITGIREIQPGDLPEAPRIAELAQRLARLIR